MVNVRTLISTGLVASALAAPNAFAQTITVQAEDFFATGGTYNGFQTYTASAGVTAINHNQVGDWADYTVTIPESGQYTFNILAATPTSGAAATLTFNNGQVVAANIPNNGGWNNFESTAFLNLLSLDAGTYTLRLESTGTSNWQFNADKIEIIRLLDSDGDGVIDGADQCPNTPAGTPILPTGCPIPQEPTEVKVTVEAEGFDATGGDYNGVETYVTAGGIGATNWMQTGDWMSYDITIPVSGMYQPIIHAGTTVDGAAATVYVGTTASYDTIPNNGNWNQFEARHFIRPIWVNAGQTTLKVVGDGTNANGWEFNADKIELLFLPDTDGDGVIDNNDDCPNTPPNTVVLPWGCPVPQ